MERARVRLSPEGRYIEANPEALQLLGVTREQLEAADVSTFTPPEYRDVVMEAWRVRATSGPIRSAGTTTLYPRDGQPIGVTYEDSREPDGTFVVTFAAAGPPPPPSSFVSLLALMLRGIREAEHQLEGLPADSADRPRLEADIAGLRYAYELMVRARIQQS
jgi:PAS domain S-box-containing protein